MNKFFLYIDILGFSDLVRTGSNKVDELYEIIASLNVHRHPNFKAIIFSDTILIYNTDEPRNYDESRYLVMYLCEFAQDLHIRLTGRQIVFRAIITRGEFYHYHINEVPCFYGKALIDAYLSEKKIKATGLFLENSCASYCTIFDHVKYNEQYRYIFLIKYLKQLEIDFEGVFPIDEEYVEQTDLAWVIMPEIISLENIYKNAISHSDKKVKAKYSKTFSLYQKKYPKTINKLIENNFAPNFISPSYNWQPVIERYPEDYSYIRKMKV